MATKRTLSQEIFHESCKGEGSKRFKLIEGTHTQTADGYTADYQCRACKEVIQVMVGVFDDDVTDEELATLEHEINS